MKYRDDAASFAAIMRISWPIESAVSVAKIRVWRRFQRRGSETPPVETDGEISGTILDSYYRDSKYTNVYLQMRINVQLFPTPCWV